MAKRKALGKGLSALIPEADRLEERTFFHCPIETIEPNPHQPRQSFEDEDMEALALSVREKGIITPLLVSKMERGGYRLIAGERRWRAAQKAGLDEVPVVVRETTPTEALELALVENIHRKDLNPIEEAQAYKRLLETTRATQEVLAKNLGRDRSTIANMLRLLNLPQTIQQDLIDERLSMGQARILAGIKDPEQQGWLRDRILKEGLTVRQLEALLRKERAAGATRRGKRKEDPYIQSLSDVLKRSLGTKVEIKRRGKQGSIVIHFYSDDELGRLLDILS
jgi:ParB family chromosome partitioning protein